MGRIRVTGSMAPKAVNKFLHCVGQLWSTYKVDIAMVLELGLLQHYRVGSLGIRVKNSLPKSNLG